MATKRLEVERLAYSVEDAAAAAGISRDLIYQAIKAGTLLPKCMGKRTLIPAERLRTFIDSLPDMPKARPSPSPNGRLGGTVKGKTRIAA